MLLLCKITVSLYYVSSFQIQNIQWDHGFGFRCCTEEVVHDFKKNLETKF